MRNLFALSVLSLCAVFAGCHGSHHGGGDPGKLWLTDVVIDEDNVVTATVHLPEYHYGLLYLDGSTTATAIVIADGEIVLGEFELGDYSLCLELFLSPDGAALLSDPRRRFPLFADHTGEQECCDFSVYPYDGEPDPDPTPDPEAPSLSCSVNSDGAVLITLHNIDVSVSVSRSSTGEEPVLIDELDVDEFGGSLDGVVIVDLGLEAGVYTFTIEGEDVSLSCDDLVILDDEDNNDDDNDDRVRYLICHNGHGLLLPKHAAQYHLDNHAEDSFGSCDN